jgi:hypothetical protein
MPWVDRHQVWTAMGTLLLVIGLGAGLGSLAGCGKTASSAARPSAPTRYANAASLVAAMKAHGFTCAGVKYIDSSGASCKTPATMLLTFSNAKATSPRLRALGNAMIKLAADLHQTNAADMGPNWLVVSTPGYVTRVQHALGGQLLRGTNTPLPACPALQAASSLMMFTGPVAPFSDRQHLRI